MLRVASHLMMMLYVCLIYKKLDMDVIFFMKYVELISNAIVDQQLLLMMTIPPF